MTIPIKFNQTCVPQTNPWEMFKLKLNYITFERSCIMLSLSTGAVSNTIEMLLFVHGF